jgi:hypothetical protein
MSADFSDINTKVGSHIWSKKNYLRKINLLHRGLITTK